MPGGGEDHLGEAVHAPRRLAIDPCRRIEILQLAGEMDAVILVVEQGDLRRARLAVDQPLPRRFDVVAERRDHAEARDHDPAAAVAGSIRAHRVSRHHIPIPPSTSNTSPVMNAAASEQRNRTAPATSSGSPRRPSGVFCNISARISSAISSVNLEWMYPGATTFARTPRLPSSRASAFV